MSTVGAAPKSRNAARESMPQRPQVLNEGIYPKSHVESIYGLDHIFHNLGTYLYLYP